MNDIDVTMPHPAGDALTWEPVSPGRLRELAHRVVTVHAPDPDTYRRGQILAFLSIPLFLIGLGFLGSDSLGWLASPRGHAAFNVLTDVLFCSAIAAVWLVNRRGHVTAAAIMHLSAVSVCLVVFFYYTPAVRIEVVFVEPVFVAAFVVSPWTTFIMAAVSSASFAALNTLGHGDSSLDLPVVLGLFGLAIIAYLVASCLQWAVAALRKTERDLKQDIVARRRAEEACSQVESALQVAEQRNRTLLEESPAGVFLYDRRLLVTECNARFATQMGSTKPNMIGTDCHRTLDQQVVPAMERALVGEVASYEGPFTCTPGGELWISLTTSPLVSTDNQVIGGIGVMTDRSDIRQADELVKRLAYRDGVTGLPNRTLFHDRLTQAVAQADRHRQHTAVGVLNIDRFKDVNDSLGHEWGDVLLVGVGERIEALLRDGDTVARSGSDEFLVMFSEVADASEAASVAERILEALRRPWRLGNGTFYVSASLGLAVFPDDGFEPRALLEHAYSAMRRVKQLGGNAQELYNRCKGTAAAERLSLESELHTAIDERQFLVYYQPQIDVSDNVVVGLEALVRWQHPTRGLLPPEEFITLAEETGLIVPLGEQVLRMACEEALRWQMPDSRPLPVAVNVSGRQLRDSSLLDTITRVLAETGLASGLLEIELTETATLGEGGSSENLLHELHKTGIGIALDDFGTGYSSLSHLRRLPISRLKIDRHFVNGLPADRGSAAVVSATIGLAESLGLAVVAEGVETAEQLEFLRAHGCREVQGFLFSPPMSTDALRELLLRRDAVDWARSTASLRVADRREDTVTLTFDQVRQAGLPAYWYGSERELRYDSAGATWSHTLGDSQSATPGGRWRRVNAEDAPADGWVHDAGCFCDCCRTSSNKADLSLAPCSGGA